MSRQENNDEFKAGDQVLIPASVLRMRGPAVEVQLADGQLVRTPAGDVMRRETSPEAKPAKTAPENKAVRPAENKSGRKGR